jgi:DbpA RNA binding domain
MKNNDLAVTLAGLNDRKKRLKDQVQKVIASYDLEGQQQMVNSIALELNTSVLVCAAAIAYLNEECSGRGLFAKAVFGNTSQALTEKPLNQPGIRRVRYRLDLGNQHKVALDEIKTVLVQESGVDINQIANVRILDCYTLIDLPDEMPQEIFHHLKTIEINGQKLAIRRVKLRNKKRADRKYQQPRPDPSTSSKK